MTTAYTKPPRAVRWASALLIRLINLGVPLGPMWLMEGRQTFPVDLIRFDGHDWLVSVFGESAWVRKARATGEVRLSRGRRAETFAAVEVTGEQGAAVFAELRRQARFNPLPQRGLRAEHGHPVFRIEPH